MVIRTFEYASSITVNKSNPVPQRLYLIYRLWKSLRIGMLLVECDCRYQSFIDRSSALEPKHQWDTYTHILCS